MSFAAAQCKCYGHAGKPPELAGCSSEYFMLDAITANTKTWAWASIRGLRDLGYVFTIRWSGEHINLVPVDFAAVLQLLHAHAGQVWHGIDVCPRTCPSQGAT